MTSGTSEEVVTSGTRGDPPVGIVGAGPGGLAAGAALEAKGIPFEIVDEGRRPGGIWDLGRARTPMYETAHFISSRTLSAFPDLPMPEDYPDYPRHDQVLAYIESYAAHHGLDEGITFGRTVLRATPSGDDGEWIVELDGGETRRYSALIVATGLAWQPNLPEIPGDFRGEAIHSFDYRGPEQLEGRRVLVVGGGNSGCDIACDAARAAKATRWRSRSPHGSRSSGWGAASGPSRCSSWRAGSPGTFVCWVRRSPLRPGYPGADRPRTSELAPAQRPSYLAFPSRGLLDFLSFDDAVDGDGSRRGSRGR